MAARLITLDEIAEGTSREGGWPSGATLEAWRQGGDESRQLLSFLMPAARLNQDGQKDAALACLLDSRRVFHCWPLPVMSNLIHLCREMGREQHAAHLCLQFAQDAFGMGYDDLGLEAASAALILDAQADYEITRSPERSAAVAALYERAAGSPPGRHEAPPPNRPASGPLRVALIVPNLVDYIVAYSRRVLHFARWADPARYQLRVYVTENHAARSAPLFPCGCVEAATPERGARTLEDLRALNIPVHLCPRHLRVKETAWLLARRLEEEGNSALIVQSGLSAPMDWLAARWARLPAKSAIHIGSSLFMSGLNVTFYDNPANPEREAAWWPAEGGERLVIPSGLDLAILDEQTPFAREQFGIPPEAVLIGTLSNHLDRRLSEPFVQLLCGVLQRHPQAWYLGFGTPPSAEAQAPFKQAGVAHRVRWGGRQSQSGSALKVLDIYANEFPVGGSQSVLEAMACGLPVVAACWSLAHAESAGAHSIGDEFAIPGPDAQAYARRLEEWVLNPESRKTAGQALRRRAQESFGIQAYVDRILSALGRMACDRD